MINKAGNRWPIVQAHTANGIAPRKDSAVQFSSQRRHELVNHENNVPPKTFYIWEKGTLIDIYA